MLFIKTRPKSILFILLGMIYMASAIAQTTTNDFKIGMFGEKGKLDTYGNPKYLDDTFHSGTQVYAASTMTQFSKDGFNIVQVYEPYIWTNNNFLRQLATVANKKNMQILPMAYHWFWPDNSTTPTTFRNEYDNSTGARPNYSYFINNVYSDPSIKNVFWGQHLTEEASGIHCYNPTNSPPPSTCGWCGSCYLQCEVVPGNVNQAIADFRGMLSAAGIGNEKIVLMEAAHGKSINDNTTDPGIYNPQDYINMTNRPDVFLEASYKYFAHDNEDIVKDYWKIFHNEDHYLGFLKSIDYARKRVPRVHKVINTETTNYSNVFHYNEWIPNANWLWFQAYGSIVHGASGIWFWEYNSSYKACEKYSQLILQYGYTNSELIDSFRKIYPKQAWIPDGDVNCYNTTNVINNGAVIAIKDLFEGVCTRILDAKDDEFDSTNFPMNYKYYTSNLARELRYLKEKGFLKDDNSNVLYSKLDTPDRYCVLPAANTYVTLPEYLTGQEEFYGLRYTIRTNGNEAIMIIVNPLPSCVTTVLDFSQLSNPIIKNATGVEMLFNDGSIAPNSPSYKLDRNSLVDWQNKTVGKTHSYSFFGNKQLLFTCGPLDAIVLKFQSGISPISENGWSKKWTNNENGDLPNWGRLSASHSFYIGDYDGDGKDDILLTNNSATNGLAKIVSFNESTNTFDLTWTNNSNGLLETGWPLLPSNKYVIGDYDGDGRSDILALCGNCPWATMLHFNHGIWNWGWSNYGNGLIETGWPQDIDQQLIPGDFDGDGKDEILAICSNCPWATMLHFDFGIWNWGWSNYGSGVIDIWPVDVAHDKYYVGDFDHDGKDELLCRSNTGILARIDFTGGSWHTIWTNTAPGVPYLNAPLPNTDKILTGNIDEHDLNDEIMMIERGSGASASATFDFTGTSISTPVNNWSNFLNAGYLSDWELPYGLMYGQSNYWLYGTNTSGIKNLLAIKYTSCDNAYISIYSSTTNNNKPADSSNIKKQTALNNNSVLSKVYPVPATKELYISHITETEYAIYNITGVKVKEGKLMRSNAIDISGLLPGYYFINYVDEANASCHRNFTKR